MISCLAAKVVQYLWFLSTVLWTANEFHFFSSLLKGNNKEKSDLKRPKRNAGLRAKKRKKGANAPKKVIEEPAFFGCLEGKNEREKS